MDLLTFRSHQKPWIGSPINSSPNGTTSWTPSERLLLEIGMRRKRTLRRALDERGSLTPAAAVGIFFSRWKQGAKTPMGRDIASWPKLICIPSSPRFVAHV